jgi:hypothetical protein
VLYLVGGYCSGSQGSARVLPRSAGGLLAVGTVIPVAFVLLPHELLRLAAVSVGCALVWLGFALRSERRVKVSQMASIRQPAELRHTEGA